MMVLKLHTFQIHDNTYFPISKVYHFTTSLRSLVWLHFMNNAFFIPKHFQEKKYWAVCINLIQTILVCSDRKLTVTVENLSKGVLVYHNFSHSCLQITNVLLRDDCKIIRNLEMELFYKSTISGCVEKYNTKCEYLHSLRNEKEGRERKEKKDGREGEARKVILYFPHFWPFT